MKTNICKTMINAFLIILIVFSFNSCKKNCPEPDMMGYGLPTYYTNKYILNKIDAEIVTEKDTVKYNEIFIQVNLSGYLVSENTYFTEVNIEDDPNPYAVEPIEQKYFINKLISFNVYSDKIYNDSIYHNNKISHITILFRDKEMQYFSMNFYDKELGYTPVKVCLTEPPDTSKWISFTIELIDKYNNRFVAQTGSIFITK